MLALKYFFNTQTMLSKYATKVRSCKPISRLIWKTYAEPYDIPEGIIESCPVENGMRIICECKESFTTTVGCFFPAGAMYELPEERGSALFLEHLLFRRTANKTQRQIEKELGEIGGRIISHATRDMFVFHGTVVSCNVDRLIALFADVLLNGIICEEDVSFEKYIILHELFSMEFNWESVAMDHLPSIAYQDTELAKSVYPESNTIKNFCAESLVSFRNRALTPCFMTMVSTGGTSLCNLHASVCKYFMETTQACEPLLQECKVELLPGSVPYRFSGAELRLRDDDESIGHVALGIEGPGYARYQDYCALTVAKEIVGSWDMTSSGANHNAPYLAHCAFNSGLCQMYRSFHLAWAHTGIWGCYFACDKLKLEEMLMLLQIEWMRLSTTITQKEMDRAINRCKALELLKLNNPMARICDIITNLSQRGHYESFQKRIARYEEITTDTIREVADKYIYDQCPAVVALGRIENVPTYCEIRNRMYSWRY